MSPPNALRRHRNDLSRSASKLTVPSQRIKSHVRQIRNRDLPLALADCDAALRKGRIAEYMDSRGLVLLRMGRYEEAIAAFNDALKRQPKLASSFYGRGLAETAKGMKAQGEADISAAVALRPTIIQTAKLYGLTAEGFAPIAPAPAKSTQ